ncbi:MAG: S-formylglutathione hydrolase [Deltaproteobacteria bacterium]|nr:S-formylglutathione hydrolase [Deltaproteobacteria bacterium]
MDTIETHGAGGGTQLVLEHASRETGTTMRFGLFLPPKTRGLLVFLSGLTCTEQNVLTKGHFQAAATACDLAVLCPDTSPRGEGVPDDDGWDFGQGAGFYLDATEEPWSAHFRMRSYLHEELLPAALERTGVDASRVGITGHSMGGHGALVLGLSEPDRYRSVSAFSPIASATRCPWGHKALGGYLGPDAGHWAAQDASLLLAKGYDRDLLVDQGLADGFLEEQLKPELLEEAGHHGLTLRRHPGYDHGYYFVASFLPEHVRWHAERLV